ncbi:MAG: hypothetical protein ACR2P6_08150 [Gammaproteobacteria bacterium]
MSDTPQADALAHLAAEGEQQQDYWHREFAWLLKHRFVSIITTDHRNSDLRKSLCAELSLNPGWIRRNKYPELALGSLHARLRPLLMNGHALSLDISDIGPAVSISAAVDTLCIQTAHAHAGLGTPATDAPLTISVSGAASGLQDFLQTQRDQSELPVRFAIRLPVAHKTTRLAEPESADKQRLHKELWRDLLILGHNCAGISLVPSATTRELSCLHARERGNTVMPAGLFEVPANSAWLNLHLNVHRCFDKNGNVENARLHRILKTTLRLADNLIDKTKWPWPGLQIDALANRRIAIHLVGIGELVDRSRQNPASFSTLYRLRGNLRQLKKLLLAESADLANQRGVFPEYRVGDLVSKFSDRYGVKEAKKIVYQHALRHRHLLAISPFDVFPRHRSKYPLADYMNLLPLIFVANTVTARGDALRHSLSLKQYQRTLQMASAVFANSH